MNDLGELTQTQKEWIEFKEEKGTMTSPMRYYYRNREEHLKRMREYHAKNKDKISTKAKKRYKRKKIEWS